MQTKYNQLNVNKIYRPYSKKRDVIENIRFNTKGPGRKKKKRARVLILKINPHLKSADVFWPGVDLTTHSERRREKGTSRLE